jgi:hypothetical protein
LGSSGAVFVVHFSSTTGIFQVSVLSAIFLTSCINFVRLLSTSAIITNSSLVYLPSFISFAIFSFAIAISLSVAISSISVFHSFTVCCALSIFCIFSDFSIALAFSSVANSSRALIIDFVSFAGEVPCSTPIAKLSHLDILVGIVVVLTVSSNH